MYDLEMLSLRAMTECGAVLRSLHVQSGSMEEVCERMVRYLYDTLRADDQRACTLVRAYVTRDVGELEPELRQTAAQVAGHELDPATKCLKLLASAGDEPDWNAPGSSKGHRVLPLVSADLLERLPMVAQLVRQLGLDAQAVIAPGPELIVDLQQRTFNVFHVEEASGSPWIPAQDFVQRYGVRSVVGFGTMLPNGDLFALILFSRVPVPRETAELFRPLALAAKLSLLPFVSNRIPAVPHDA